MPPKPVEEKARSIFLPRWKQNPDWHLVLRSTSVLIGGMAAQPIASLGFYNQKIPQPMHMDDTALASIASKPNSPFYRRGPNRKSECQRPTSCIATLFEDEKRSIAVFHPSNKKHIYYNEMGVFDGATVHCGLTNHPGEVTVEQLDGSKRRLYNSALHGHIDSMLMPPRNDNQIDQTGIGEEEFKLFEAPERSLRAEDPKVCALAHLRNCDDVERGTRILLEEQRVLNHRNVTGIIAAKVLAQSVACKPTKDLEDGVNTAFTNAPQIAKGTKTAPALLAVCQGILLTGASTKNKHYTTAAGRALLEDASNSLQEVFDKHKAFLAREGLINKFHENADTDDEEDIRRTKPKNPIHANFYDRHTGELIYKSAEAEIDSAGEDE